jgi:hypothetical protein
MQLNKKLWIQTAKVLNPSLEGVDQLFAERQAEIDDVLRKKDDALRQRGRRAKGGRADSVRWQVSFDRERLTKGSGLIDCDEIAPFCDCKNMSEYLTTTRMFSYAFRANDQDCEDIKPGEKIIDFMRRVQALWYSTPLGQVMSLVRLDNCEFDDDAGFKRDVPVDWENDWSTPPGYDVMLTAEQIAALPMVGKPVPSWKIEGFESHKDWWEHEEEKQRKQKAREQLEQSLRTKEQIDRDLNKTPSEETKTPTLLYQGAIIEH